jgi:ribulose-5-phosphate 4-epimerase/fuculose-1-phosphate aldolase
MDLVEIRELKKRLAIANKTMGYWLQQLGEDFYSISAGHISARIPGTDTCLLKGRPTTLDLLSAVDETYIVTVDINTDEKVGGEPDVRPIAEIPAHTAVYRARPDVMAVAHGHSNFICLAGALGLNLVPLRTHGSGVLSKPIPIFPNSAGINNTKIGNESAKALGDATAVLLRGHGANVVSCEGPEEAIMNLMHLENQAKLNIYAFSAIGKDYVKFRIPEPSEAVIRRAQTDVEIDRHRIHRYEISEYCARMAKY